MAFFKLIFLLHCVGLVLSSSYGGANSFSNCNHTNIAKVYTHLLQRHIITSSIMATSESLRERENVINCCPKSTETNKKRETVLSCIHNFTRVCIASHHPEVWNHTASLLGANCSGFVGQMDNAWNGTVTHKNSTKCKYQRRKIIANQECGNHTLQELQMMWNYYKMVQ